MWCGGIVGLVVAATRSTPAGVAPAGEQEAHEQHARGVEKVDSAVQVTQHRGLGKPRQLRCASCLVLVALLAASSVLSAQNPARQGRGVPPLALAGNSAPT